MYKIQQRKEAEDEMERLLADCDTRLPALERARAEAAQSLGGPPLHHHPQHRTAMLGSSSNNRQQQSPMGLGRGGSNISSNRPLHSRPATSMEVTFVGSGADTSRASTSLGLASPSAANPHHSQHVSSGTSRPQQLSPLASLEQHRNPMRTTQGQRESTALLRALLSTENAKDTDDRRWSPVKKGDGRRTQKLSLGLLAGAVTRDNHRPANSQHPSSSQGATSLFLQQTVAVGGSSVVAANSRAQSPTGLGGGSLSSPRQTPAPSSPGGGGAATYSRANNATNTPYGHSGGYSSGAGGFIPRDCMALGAGTRGLGPAGDAIASELLSQSREAFADRARQRESKGRGDSPTTGANHNSGGERLTYAQQKALRELRLRKLAIAARLQREADAAGRAAQTAEVAAHKRWQADVIREEKAEKEASVAARMIKDKEEKEARRQVDAATREQLWEYHDEALEASLKDRTALRESILAHRCRKTDEIKRLQEANAKAAGDVRAHLAGAEKMRGSFDAAVGATVAKRAAEVRHANAVARPKALLDVRRQRRAARDEELRRKAYERVVVEQHSYEHQLTARERRAAMGRPIRLASPDGGRGHGDGSGVGGNNPSSMSVSVADRSGAFSFSSSSSPSKKSPCAAVIGTAENRHGLALVSPMEAYEQMMERLNGGGGDTSPREGA